MVLSYEAKETKKRADPSVVGVEKDTVDTQDSLGSK